jgi:DNA-binding CsgD family transcriptional regulator
VDVAMNVSSIPRSGWGGLFGAAFAESENGMMLTDDARHIVEVNPAFCRLVRRSKRTLLELRLPELVAGGPLLSDEEWRAAILRDEITGECELVRSDQVNIRVQLGVHPEVVTGQRFVLFVVMPTSRWGRQFRRRGDNPGRPDQLSDRELEIIELVALGATSPEISGTLHISHHTVRKHVDNAMRKVGARSRAHLVAKALAEGTLKT